MPVPVMLHHTGDVKIPVGAFVLREGGLLLVVDAQDFAGMQSLTCKPWMFDRVPPRADVYAWKEAA